MQKLLSACVILSCLLSCKESLNPEAIKGVNRSLEEANAALLEYNQNIERELEEKALAPRTMAKAKLWQPKSLRISKLSKEVTGYIDLFKKGLNAGNEDADKNIRSFKDNRGAVLYDTLVAFCSKIKAVFDTSELPDNAYLRANVEKDITLLVPQMAARFGVSDSASTYMIDGVAWVSKTFPTDRALLVQAILNKLKNDVLTAENELLTYCDEQTISHMHEHNAYHPLVVMDRSYVKAGQRIEVMAGIGEFKLTGKIKVTIGRRPVPESDGICVYRFVATGKPGNYKIPVTIEYTQSDGSRSIITKQLYYTILK